MGRGLIVEAWRLAVLRKREPLSEGFVVGFPDYGLFHGQWVPIFALGFGGRKKDTHFY